MVRSLLAIAASVLLAPSAFAAVCLECHRDVTPSIVTDWEVSRHAFEKVTCDDCHGDGHQSEDDVANVETVTYETCAECHEEKTEQFLAGKHSKAWAAMRAMPTAHWQPMELMEGQKGCGGCHKIGVKSPKEIHDLESKGSSFGHASCDACHTRHTFSIAEARQPEACATCHMGFDHPQWEMYSTSKHGVRHGLRRQGVIPASSAAPSCQACHMPDGAHEVRTAWGFFAVRLDDLGPYPGEDATWWADRLTILQALGVLDPEGRRTERFDLVAGADVMRLTAEAFDAERARMIAVCGDCHSENFANEELAKGDEIIRKIDHVMAEAIRIVADLYRDGVLAKPDTYARPFPDLLAFHDAPTPIENRLFNMHLKHRMRAFQGTFHANPDYALWYGWSEMVQDLREIRQEAAELREKRRG